MKSKLLILLLLSLCSISALNGFSQTIDKQKQAKLESYMESYNKQGVFNGVVLIAEKGKPILSKGYGFANIEFQVPNTPATKFMIASVSKTFTAVAIMRLIDQGKLSIDSKLSDVLKWYRTDAGNEVTVKHLLNHTSGIPNYLNMKNRTVDDAMKEWGNGPIDKTDFAKKYCMRDLEYKPGTIWMYNNSGYFLLGLIIEEVTGKTYEEAIHELILDPLGMLNSDDRQPNPYMIVDNLATGYMRQFSRFTFPSYWNMSTTYAAGSLYSTSEDLLKFDRALYSESFLSKTSRDAMFTAGLSGWGCGWELRESPIGIDSTLKKIRTHEGYLMSWNTRFYQIPDEQYLIVLLSNAGNAPLEKIFKGICDILYNRTVENMKPLIANEISKVLTSGNLEKQLDKCRTYFKIGQKSWDFDEVELNRLGYATLPDNKPAAVKIFEFITEIYPTSWNAWDSYGESLALMGSNENAIKAYEKSLALNPDNRPGKEALVKLKDIK